MAERKVQAQRSWRVPWDATPSVGKRESRLCDPFSTASCCNGLAAYGGGVGCTTRSLAPTASYGLWPCHPLDPQSPRSQAVNPSAPHQRQGSHCVALPSGAAVGDGLCWRRPHGACWSCHPWRHPSGGDQTPLVAAGWGGMGFESGGVKHHHLWLCAIGWLWGIGC